MGLFKTKEEKLADGLLKAEKEAARVLKEYQDKRYEEALDRITVFPGNLSEYEAFVGYKAKIMDTGRPDKGVDLTDRLKRELGERLLADGFEAIINVQFRKQQRYEYNLIYPYGLPVKKA